MQAVRRLLGFAAKPCSDSDNTDYAEKLEGLTRNVTDAAEALKRARADLAAQQSCIKTVCVIVGVAGVPVLLIGYGVGSIHCSLVGVFMVGLSRALNFGKPPAKFEKAVEHAEAVHEEAKRKLLASLREFQKSQDRSQRAIQAAVAVCSAGGTGVADIIAFPGIQGRAEAAPADTSETENICIICMDSERAYAFIPCGHAQFCKQCAEHEIERTTKCPVCQCRATGLLRLFT